MPIPTPIPPAPQESARAALPAEPGDPLELIRYALLAPSSHDTQPWRFAVRGARIDLYADESRWLRVSDPERRELHLSLGAALENLLLAAEHLGYRRRVDYFPDPARPDRVASVPLLPADRRHQPPLFGALPRRRTNRRPYAGAAVDGGVLADLAAVCWDSGIWAWSSAEPGVRARVASLVARGDRREFADARYRRELAEWIGRGLLGLPRPLARLAALSVSHLDLGERVARADARLVEGAGAVLVVVSKEDDALTHLRAGQALERVWLLATRLGLALHPMSAPLQAPELRRELAELIGAAEAHPQHLFRLGYAAPETRRARRRPLEEVLLP